ncbi:MAG: VOC family protein [Gammaproteobacteria bacterium]|nr:VOC family protein [Gammaproteobacteria bacterium]
MDDGKLTFDHIHLLAKDPHATAKWYEDVLGGTIRGSYETRNAPQINVHVGGMTLLIRGQREGEEPAEPTPMRDYADYSSHNEWGTDHFGYTYRGDLKAYCESLRGKGAEFAVEPWEFNPGNLICYLAAPDGVSIEIVEGK